MILPEIRKTVKEEIQSELSVLGARMEGEFKAVHSEIARVDERIGSLDQRLNGRIDNLHDKIEGLDKRLDVVQRLAVVEAKLKEYEQAQHRD